MLAALFALGCSNEGPSGSSFTSSVLNRSRTVDQLSGPEARLLCDEGVAFVDGTFADTESWIQAYCRWGAVNYTTDQTTCEMREQDCHAEFEATPFFYVYSYSEDCNSLEGGSPSDCTVLVEDIEHCYEEISAGLREMASRSCANAAEFTDGDIPLSPGCRALFDTGAPCRPVLGR